MSENIINVTDDNFDTEVLQAGLPVLVDFWAEWCGPCKMLAPLLEEIAGEYASKIKFAKMNVDESSATPNNYSIRGIPTLILFQNGAPIATKVGAISKEQLKSFLEESIKS